MASNESELLERLRRDDLPNTTIGRLAQTLRNLFAQSHGRARRAAGESSHTLKLDLLQWMRRFLPEHARLPPSTMHRWLAAELDRMSADRSRGHAGVKLNVLAPRGSAKSTLATLALPLRAAVESTEPYIWIVSDTADQARAHLANIAAELQSNPQLARAYPRATGKGNLWRAGRIELPSGTVIEAFGTGQKLRGRRRRADRPTLIVCDDLQNDSHIRSTVARERSREWFDGALIQAGDRRTHVVNLATALHQDAIAMRLARTPGWRSRTFRAIECWPENMSLWSQWESIYTDVASKSHAADADAFYRDNREAMDRGARLLWPELEDLQTLMRMRAENGHAAFEREKQNSPVNPAECEWPESYFDESIWFERWPDRLQARVMALDPSKGKDARRGDFSAFVMLGVARDGTLYVEADCRRRPVPQIVDDGAALIERFAPELFGVETNQFQELLAAEFDRALRRANILLQPVGIDNRTNKLVRIRRLGPLLAGRRIKFKDGSADTRLLVDQLRQFPLSDHDDGPDALEMAVRLAGDLMRPNRSSDDGLGDRLQIPFL